MTLRIIEVQPDGEKPRPDRFDTPAGLYDESGYTREAWAALVHSPAVAKLRAIIFQALELGDAIGRYLDQFGDSDPWDAGEDAIRAAGVPVPKVVEDSGTPLHGIDKDVSAVLWVLRQFTGFADEAIPDPAAYGPDGSRLAPVPRGNAA